MNRPIMIAALVASLCWAADSRAGDCCGSGYGGLHSGLPYFGYGFSGSLYGLGHIPVPPYYALHPPVYYSHQLIRRPYGDSPYAYRAERPAPRPAPRIVLNPFVEDLPAAEQESSLENSEQTASTGRMILNPYYESELTLAAVDE